MTERSSQPLDPAVLSTAFQQHCDSLTSFLGRFQGWELPEQDLVIQQLEMTPLGLLEDSDDRIVQRAIPATIPRKYTEEASFAQLVVHNSLDNVISDLEHQVINGLKKQGGIQGLLSYSDHTSVERNGHDVLPFCESAIKEYLSQSRSNGHDDGSNGASSQPVLMLPREERERIADQTKLGGLRVLSSDFLPEGHGLIFSPSDLQLLVGPALEWEIDKEQTRYPFLVRYHAGLVPKRQKPLVLRIEL